MAGDYLRAAQEEAGDGPVVFYVDNHMRPFTGQEVIRKGWRMQDKRSLPGATDYYVHTEDGRPVLRITVAEHDSLTKWLPPIAGLLREALGPKRKFILAFDRAGAYPENLAELRNAQYDVVTYERRPFAKLPKSAFSKRAKLGKETLRFGEKARANLGDGRGRVRRIAVRTADGRQINLLAVSKLPAKRLIGIMRGRWVQENGFKHGVERWGINQLDGRVTQPCPPETLIPNPARRRLDRDLRLAWMREGNARAQLARLPEGDPRREPWSRDLDQALAQQQELRALRPQTPKHAPLRDTELAGKLVRHLDRYKTTIDSVRIACANVESDLAVTLAAHLRRPAEAKKVLANLFRAPGNVHAAHGHITVTLAPAANRSERKAIRALLQEVTKWRLTLPDDPRPLRFQSQV
jgi:hypothetical protein